MWKLWVEKFPIGSKRRPSITHFYQNRSKYVEITGRNSIIGQIWISLPHVHGTRNFAPESSVMSFIPNFAKICHILEDQNYHHQQHCGNIEPRKKRSLDFQTLKTGF